MIFIRQRKRWVDEDYKIDICRRGGLVGAEAAVHPEGTACDDIPDYLGIQLKRSEDTPPVR
jgi:hypothetical protein